MVKLRYNSLGGTGWGEGNAGKGTKRHFCEVGRGSPVWLCRGRVQGQNMVGGLGMGISRAEAGVGAGQWQRVVGMGQGTRGSAQEAKAGAGASGQAAMAGGSVRTHGGAW